MVILMCNHCKSKSLIGVLKHINALGPNGVCDRCLETYTFAVNRDFRLSLCRPVPPESAREETELKKDELAVGFIVAEKIDLDDIIREQIYLSLPMKLLCKNGCAGLCTRCGANLNMEACKCSGNSGHPAFLKLKELQIQ